MRHWVAWIAVGLCFSIAIRLLAILLTWVLIISESSLDPSSRDVGVFPGEVQREWIV